MSALTAHERVAFVAAARGFKGARWAHQGRRPGRMDCVGLIALSLAAIGRPVRDRTDYGRMPHNRKLRSELAGQFRAVLDGPKPGDVVTLRWKGEEHHVAIVTDHPEGLGLIHCWASVPGVPSGGGRVVEHRMDEAWRNRIVEVFRP